MRLYPVLAACALAGTPAFAAGPLAVTTQVLVETRTLAPDGTVRSVLGAPTRVGPGDRVVVRLAYRNSGTQPIADLVLADPVPPTLVYRGAQPGSPAPEVSVDGKLFGPLATLRVPAANGGTRAATADDVTSVRWRLASPVAAGARGELAFQAAVK